MSQKKMESAVHQLAAGISHRDLDALQSVSDPHMEYTSRFTAIEGKRYRGYEGWADYLADLEAAWEDFQVTIEEFIPVAAEKLVSVVRIKALARGSGVPIDQLTYPAWEFRDGKLVRGRTCASREEALEALALPEQGAQGT